MLHNPKYIGIAHLSDGVYDNIYPPIVPKPLFDEVQAILAKINSVPKAAIPIIC